MRDDFRLEKALANASRDSFVAGEFGFFDRPDDYAAFLHAVDKAGGKAPANLPPIRQTCC